jgi:hypothetical protein
MKNNLTILCILSVFNLLPKDIRAQESSNRFQGYAVFTFENENKPDANPVGYMPKYTEEFCVVSELLDHAQGKGAMNTSNKSPQNIKVENIPKIEGKYLMMSLNRESDMQTPIKSGGSNESTWFTFTVVPTIGNSIDFTKGLASLETYAVSSLNGPTIASYTLYYSIDDGNSWKMLQTKKGASITGPGFKGPVLINWKLNNIGVIKNKIHFLLDTVSLGQSNGVLSQRSIGIDNLAIYFDPIIGKNSGLVSINENRLQNTSVIEADDASGEVTKIEANSIEANKSNLINQGNDVVNNPIDELSARAPNAIAWVTSQLEVAMPNELRENFILHRENILDYQDIHQYDKKILDSAVVLCTAIINAVDERESTQLLAKLHVSKATSNFPLSNQALEARRNYKMSWPQFTRELEQREVLRVKQQHQGEVELHAQQAKWTKRAVFIRRSLDMHYSNFREAKRDAGMSPVKAEQGSKPESDMTE